MMSMMREAILFHVDTGVSKGYLEAEMAECKSCDDERGLNKHDMEDFEATFTSMVNDETLTVGLLHGCSDFIVVTTWSPTSAAEIRMTIRP